MSLVWTSVVCNDLYTPYAYSSRSVLLLLMLCPLTHLPLTIPILRLHEIGKRLRLLVSMPICKLSQLHAQSPPPNSVCSGHSQTLPVPTFLSHTTHSPTPPTRPFNSPSRYPNDPSKTRYQEIGQRTFMRMRVIRWPDIFHLIHTAALRTAPDWAVSRDL